MIEVSVTRGKNLFQGINITFPTTQEKFEAALKSCHVEDYKIRGISCTSVPPLARHLDRAVTPDELQYIAAKISELNADERDTLSAFLECGFGDDKRTIKTVMDALENLHTCQLDKAVMSYEDLGRSSLEARRDTCRPAIDRLAVSSEIEDKNLSEYITALEEYVDAAIIGRDLAEQNDQYITPYGLLSVDWQDYFWRDDRKVPDEYRITNKAQPSILRTLEDNKSSIAPAQKVGAVGKNEPDL